MSTKLSLDEMTQALVESQQAFLALIATIAPAALYTPVGDDGWAAGAILLHISEARQHFAGDINTLVDSNFAEPPKKGKSMRTAFGRGWQRATPPSPPRWIA